MEKDYDVFIIGGGNLGLDLFSFFKKDNNCKLLTKSLGHNILDKSFFTNLKGDKKKIIFYCIGKQNNTRFYLLDFPIQICKKIRPIDNVIFFTTNNCASKKHPEKTEFYKKEDFDEETQCHKYLEKIATLKTNVKIIRTNNLYGQHKKENNFIEYIKELKNTTKTILDCYVSPTNTKVLSKNIYKNIDHILKHKINHYSASGYVHMSDIYYLINKEHHYFIEKDIYPIPYFKIIGNSFGKSIPWFYSSFLSSFFSSSII